MISRERLEELYLPPVSKFVVVDVPEMTFFMIDGQGNPKGTAGQAALDWLFKAVHPIKCEARERMGAQFIEPPLEGLFWANDMADLVSGKWESLNWRFMIPAPPWVTSDSFATVLADLEPKLGEAPTSLRLDAFQEGESVQTMHVGPYERVRETLDRLHREFLPSKGLVAHGAHHEIYLNDPQRTAPEKLKTVLRQPVLHAAKSSSST